MTFDVPTLWTSTEIAEATGGEAHGHFAVTGVAFDSREVGPGDLFIAMRGETTDGHRFIDKALAAGAAGVICETAIDGPHIRVADSVKALTDLGRASRARSRATIIAVTGSVGKTGTKEAIAAALDRFRPGQVHRSVKSYNNHTGVPLSLARMPRNAEFAVLEMGMNHAGEIAALTRLARPHVAVITTIAPAHIENLGSMEAIADAKAEIFQGLEAGGTAIIPFDSPYHGQLVAAAQLHGARIVSFGLTDGADIHARDWVADSATGGSLITAELGGSSLCFSLAPPGDHWVANAMAVLAAVEAAGGDLAAAGVALAELPGLAGRGARHMIAVGSGEALLIDESYNANPASMAATIAQLGREPAVRRVVILGSMRELGEGSDGFHAALADHLERAGVARAILVGPEMRALADALAAKPLEARLNFTHEPDVAQALVKIEGDIHPGDAILIKGSNAVGLSRIVAALTGGE
ncbi:UDP-N-acetylmuramoyl-tripeptide--D-alanyl-D-alanine ligase [Sphingomonas lacunae]|uniref:UDP-N-acetylmuramoyl-tripeptide--D-alanyl-D-alanine ligase n=1 Tax=Sphingomonas lacunae TaxID=2698828 RepID=A0A6M4AVY2_9SPHN|nr:UDP-N-acetylmuramoyl-tripeptide--D-alanyl-D-alanine ligase [Sphingomonas lacunae]QJQ33307.1 UDP-N-acetylmuramoyl-tripeptide--D-alanyl-D-alanine ligase [Sphingomonas lacunae]